MYRQALGLLLLTGPGSGAAAAADMPTALTPFRAEYRLTRNDVPVGWTRVQFELAADGIYVYRAETGPNALLALWREDTILEQSRGRLLQGRLRPDDYLYRRSGGDTERQLELTFDWAGGRVRIQGESSRWSLEVPPDTLDKLVQQLQFSAQLALGGRSAQFRVADGGLLKDYSYRVLGRESVEVPMGRFDALKAERSKGGRTSDYTLWLAPVLGYQPVRILRRHHGDQYLMELESLDAPGEPPGS